MRVTIRVTPGAAHADVGGSSGDALVVRVHERAVDGRATEAALRALAKALRVSRSDVRLVSGARSRTKVVEVTAQAVDVTARLAALRALSP